MKSINSVVLLLLTACVLLVPLCALPKNGAKAALKTSADYNFAASTGSTREAAGSGTDASVKTQSSAKATSAKVGGQSTVRMYDVATKKITELSMHDYIFGVVAGECPMLYHNEAIKAQIVAARTYALFRMNENKDKEYDVTNEPQTSQTYITKQTALKNWGAAAEQYSKKLEELLKSVENEAVLYKDKPILAVYHAISSGKTESCKNVWGSDYPYLQPVESIGDKLATNYLSECVKTEEQANALLKSIGINAAQLSRAKFTKTASGNVLKVAVDGKEITGPKIVEIFNLRSQNYDITFKNKKLTITVRGYGHQAGMSQNGANYMANDGASYKEILQHYYQGTTVEKYPK